nr:importin-5-like [Ipomoea trifida]
MPLLLRSALENELHFPVSVDSPIITLPKIIIPALVQALEIAKTWALDNDEIIGSIWKKTGFKAYAKYIPFLFEASKDTVPNIQQIAARAICIYVEFDRETFKQHLRVWNSYFSTLTNTWLKKLLFVLKGKSVSSFVVKKLTCTSTLTNTWLKKLLFVLKGKSVSSFVVKKLTCMRLSTQNIITEIVYLKIMWGTGLRPYAKYIPFLFEASKDTVPNIQQIAAHAIGIYVEFDRETFKEHLRVWNSYFNTLTNTWLKKLLFVLMGKSVSFFVVKKLTCTRLMVDYPHITQTTPIFSSFNNLVKMTDNTKSVASMGKDPMCSS